MTIATFHTLCLKNCVTPSLALENDAVVQALREAKANPSPAADARVEQLINSEF